MPFIQLEDIPQSEPFQGFVGRFIHSDNMTVADWYIEEGSSFPEHTHPNEQIAFILEGMFELTLDGEVRVLSPGTIAIIPSNVPHEGRALTECHLLDMFYPIREDLRQIPE
jgi:quercetin dioxygenase-like cupin family protein